MIDRPLFMENPKWYYFDYQKKIYVLTKDAPSKAKKSYDDYYKGLKHG